MGPRILSQASEHPNIEAGSLWVSANMSEQARVYLPLVSCCRLGCIRSLGTQSLFNLSVWSRNLCSLPQAVAGCRGDDLVDQSTFVLEHRRYNTCQCRAHVQDVVESQVTT